MLPYLSAAVLTFVLSSLGIPGSDARYWGRWLGRRAWLTSRAAMTVAPTVLAIGVVALLPPADPSGFRGVLHGAVVAGCAHRVQPQRRPAGRPPEDAAGARAVLTALDRGLVERLDDSAEAAIEKYLHALVHDQAAWSRLVAEADAVEARLSARIDQPGVRAQQAKETRRQRDTILGQADVLRENPCSLGDGLVTDAERRRAAQAVAAILQQAMVELRWSAPAAGGTAR